MKFPHFFPILLIIALPILMACPPKTPGPDLQEQQQVYNIEDLPLSDNLVKQIKSGDEQKYVMYTFYNVGDKSKIHKQYWEGLIVFDDMPFADQAIANSDDDGKIVAWRQDPLRKSYSRDVYNVNGVLFRRITINPDGSAVDSVDLNGDGRADYTVASLPNGDELVIASDPLGITFLEEFLEERLSFCNNAESLGVPREEIPGCRGSSGPGESGFGTGVGPADGSNPYDSFMESMCEGYESGGASSLPGATHARNLTGVERRTSWRRIQDRTHLDNIVTEEYDDGSSRILDNQIVVEDDGTSHFITTKTEINADGSSTSSTRGFVNRPDGSTEAANSTTITSADGSSTSSGSRVIRRRDGSTTTRHWRTTTRSDGTSTTRRWERTDRADGTSSATPVTETECSNDGSCSEPVPAPDSDTENPGPEPDHNQAMAEFCDTWRRSNQDRPNDISELNRSANEERCSIEPDESASSDGSSLTENCYFDIQGRDELAEFIAGGTCVTASGGTHFDYDSSNPRACTQNRFFILERGLIMNGSSGLSAAELCEEDLACDPADF